jgi:hypothetical protein
MKRPWAALGMVLALSVFMPETSAAQTQGSGTRQSRPGMSIGQNYPNPFNPETSIPFGVGDPPTCSDQGKQHRVSLRIYNLLHQLVAVPVLKGGNFAGQPLNGLSLQCGEYVAYWDGKVVGTGREAASGVYLFRLEVDGKTLLIKGFSVK